MSLYHQSELVRGQVMSFHDRLREAERLVADELSAIRALTFEMERLLDLIQERESEGPQAA